MESQGAPPVIMQAPPMYMHLMVPPVYVPPQATAKEDVWPGMSGPEQFAWALSWSVIPTHHSPQYRREPHRTRSPHHVSGGMY